ncbi:MAG: hypothetical protein Q3992_07045 [Bacteroides sp.]|nr:hypothetical protein [Bacteroides sp.]
MRVRFMLLAITVAISVFTFSSCSEENPITPEVPKPNIPAPKPEETNPIPSFHDIKFNGNGIVMEIKPVGYLGYVTYPFKIKGTNMFLDKNLNGIKDNGEEIKDDFEGNLTLIKERGKAVFVILGDVTSFELLNQFEDKIVGEDPKYPKIRVSNIDASKCATLKELIVKDSSLEVVDLFKTKELVKLDLTDNDVRKIYLKNTTKLEEISLYNNADIDSTIDFSTLSSLKKANLSFTNIKDIVFPKSNNIEVLELISTEISKIDLSNIAKLKVLKYAGYNMTTIDISSCNELADLNLYGALSLKEIIDNKANEGKEKLKSITIGETPKLTNFDFTKYVGLTEIIAHNDLGIDINELINRLPVANDERGILVLSKKNKDAIKDQQAFNSKKWFY